MSQTAGSRATPHRARRLTPEQRRRILEKRRRQRRRRRLMVAIPAALALVAVAVGLSFALGGGKGSDDAVRRGNRAAPESMPAAAADVQAEPDEGGASIEEVANSSEPAAPDAPASATEESAMPEAPAGQGEIDQAPEALPASAGGAFSFDAAYAAALRGEVTGPRVAPDMSRVDPSKLERWPEAKEGYLPLLEKANTSEKVIAITVDDCYQGGNLRQIVQCALDNGAELTIFPIGKNLKQGEIASTVKWAWEQGMEIENHTYNHAGNHHYDDDRMTSELWYQGAMLNRVLGVNYRQHFFRPRGGDEYKDQRTHAYARQLGMFGIALWGHTATTDSYESIAKALSPGQIYLFHTIDSDRDNILRLIPYAVGQGYRIVTLNEMFGLPDNETSDLSTAPTEKPALESFEIQPLQLSATTYARAAAAVQQRLIDLGWMTGEATGVYGSTTRACMELFQLEAGLKMDGIAGAESQRVLFSDAAPSATEQRVRELSDQLDGGARKAIQEMLAG